MAKTILSKKQPEKRLIVNLRQRAGRATSGRITVRHRGGGVKKLYRLVDFGQSKIDMSAKVVAFEYDPYRTAHIMLLEYSDGQIGYQLAPQNLKIGDEIICSENADIKPGNRIKIKNIPVGTMVFNIEIMPGRGGKMVRGAGNSAKVLAQEGKFTHLEMPSKEIRKVFNDCYATVGEISHSEHRFEDVGKAGRSRLKGWRPTVRGSAMIAAAHPHGGGEGKTPIGLKYPKTPWGKHARGVRTRRRKQTDKYIIKRRKK